VKSLADDFCDFIENHEDVGWRAGCDFIRFTIVDMMREILQFREMIRVVPTADQVVILV